MVFTSSHRLTPAATPDDSRGVLGLGSAVGVDVDPHIVVVIDRHGVGLDQFTCREVASLVHRDIRTVGVALVGQNEIETVGIAVHQKRSREAPISRASKANQPASGSLPRC